jgi:hypothetical protein
MNRRTLHLGWIGAVLCLLALLAGCAGPGPMPTEKDGGIGGTGVQAE